MSAQTAPFRIIKFWTEYVRKASGLIPIDKVEYCAIGMASKTTTVARISDLKRVREAPDPDDVASNIAKIRWEFIEKHYRAWKEGQAVPEHGTPLAAWPGITAEQADIFRTAGLRAVEDIASATDSVINRIQLPGVREIQQNAKRFLDAQDSNKTVLALEEKDKQIGALNEQLEELRQMFLAQQAEAAKPRRGRPPNAPDEAAA